MDMQASELIVPSEGATCWENVMCTAQTRDHDGTRVYVPHMKVCIMRIPHFDVLIVKVVLLLLCVYCVPVCDSLCGVSVSVCVCDCLLCIFTC